MNADDAVPRGTAATTTRAPADRSQEATADTGAPKTSLRWNRPDAYHIRSTCDRFTVARRTVLGRDWYIAYRLAGEGSVKADELGALQVGARATQEERSAAIRELQDVCEAAAAADVSINQPKGE